MPFKFLKESGMPPSREFRSNFRDCKSTHCPIENGTFPDSRFPERYNCPRLIILPTCDGMEPLMRLWDKSNPCERDESLKSSTCFHQVCKRTSLESTNFCSLLKWMVLSPLIHYCPGTFPPPGQDYR